MGEFSLTIATDNASFQDGYRNEELSRILRQIADKVEDAPTEGPRAGFAFDINGNKVGNWTLDDE